MIKLDLCRTLAFTQPPNLLPYSIKHLRLSFTARIERGPSESVLSASKKDSLAAPLILPLPHLTLRPLAQPPNIPLVLDHNETSHQSGKP